MELCDNSRSETTICTFCSELFSSALLLEKHLTKECHSKISNDVGQKGVQIEMKNEPASPDNIVGDDNETFDVRVEFFFYMCKLCRH